MSNEATEMLEWRQDSCELRAASPFTDGEDPLDYVLVWDGTLWFASFENTPICDGTLLDCIHACQEDADKAIQTARGAQ